VRGKNKNKENFSTPHEKNNYKICLECKIKSNVILPICNGAATDFYKTAKIKI